MVFYLPLQVIANEFSSVGCYRKPGGSDVVAATLPFSAGTSAWEMPYLTLSRDSITETESVFWVEMNTKTVLYLYELFLCHITLLVTAHNSVGSHMFSNIML